MILENNAFMPYIIGWMAFNVLTLALVIYISIRISLWRSPPWSWPVTVTVPTSLWLGFHHPEGDLYGCTLAERVIRTIRNIKTRHEWSDIWPGIGKEKTGQDREGTRQDFGPGGSCGPGQISAQPWNRLKKF